MLRTRRSHTQLSYAYPYFPQALQTCALRLDGEGEFDQGKSIFLHDFSPGEPVPELEFKLRTDLNTLAAQGGVSASSVRFAIVARSNELLHRILLDAWPVDDVPRNWRGTIPGQLLGEKRVHIDLMCYLGDQLKRSYERAWRRGSVFSRRTFTLSAPSHASLFKVTWESFAEQVGWEKEAMWHLDYTSGNRFHEVEADEALVVALNSKLTGMQLLIESSPPNPATRASRRILLENLFSQIFSSVAHTVASDFRKWVRKGELQPDSVDDRSLTGKLLAFFEQHRVSRVDIVEGKFSDHAEMSHFIQGALAVGSALDESAWRRISK